MLLPELFKDSFLDAPFFISKKIYESAKNVEIDADEFQNVY